MEKKINPMVQYDTEILEEEIKFRQYLNENPPPQLKIIDYSKLRQIVENTILTESLLDITNSYISTHLRNLLIKTFYGEKLELPKREKAYPNESVMSLRLEEIENELTFRKNLMDNPPKQLEIIDDSELRKSIKDSLEIEIQYPHLGGLIPKILIEFFYGKEFEIPKREIKQPKNEMFIKPNLLGS